MWRKGIALSATFFLVIFLFSTSCKKKTNLLGGDVIDQNELLVSGGIDTFTFQTFTILQDSIQSKNPRYALLGTYHDPAFGAYNSYFNTQFVLSGISPDFGDISNIVIDSFILSLEYAGMYGDAYDQTIEVYQLDEMLSNDSTYYTNSVTTTNPDNWVVPGTEVMTIDENYHTVVGDDTISPQLRIALRNDKALEILQRSVDVPADFVSNEAFISYFKGLQIRTNGIVPSTPGEGNVAYFDLLKSASRMTVYFTDISTGDNRLFEFNITSDCVDYNHVEVDDAGTYLEQVIQDTISGQTEFYAQAGVSRAVVDLATLKNLPSNIIIHSADLYLPVQYAYGSGFTTPSTVNVTTSEAREFITFGEYAASSKHYLIDLRLFAQKVVTGELTDTKILLGPTAYINSAERIIFNGPNTTNKEKPKLVITYTEF